MICISIGHSDFHAAGVLAQRAQMIEIRQDLAHFSRAELAELLSLAQRSIITCRPGAYTDRERISLFSFTLEHGSNYVDIETESDPAFILEVKTLCQMHQRELIISYHNYEKTPSEKELESIMKTCYLQGADVTKIATMVSDDKDVSALLGLYGKKGRKVILGMGVKGMITRVASVPMGAEFTFASSDESAATAPGQLTEKELNEIYDILKINQV